MKATPQDGVCVCVCFATCFDVKMLQFRQCQYLLKNQIHAMDQFLLIQAKWTEIPTCNPWFEFRWSFPMIQWGREGGRLMTECYNTAINNK